ncbi:hypothetical protein EPN81_00175 [Patescibacteria group bacterium]|nr:MAG: hypothetical protein EPN81_00175 [Patescibacteria group bacterium]
MVSARYYEESGVLVLTSHAFGAGHLFGDSGSGQWWYKTWAIKGGTQEIERKRQSMGGEAIPMPCLLSFSEFTWRMVSIDPLPEFLWIRDEIARTPRGVHVPSEIVRVPWLDSTIEDKLYPWRLRVTATGPFRFNETKEVP